jgi:hypothetical protein
MESLIQQRMAVDRAKNRARITLGIAILFSATWVWNGIESGFDPLVYAMLCFVVLLFILGIRELRRALSAEAAFEAEHGTSAGVQPTIGRKPQP